jgi:hypothetical protein
MGRGRSLFLSGKSNHGFSVTCPVRRPTYYHVAMWHGCRWCVWSPRVTWPASLHAHPFSSSPTLSYGPSPHHTPTPTKPPKDFKGFRAYSVAGDGGRDNGEQLPRPPAARVVGTPPTPSFAPCSIAHPRTSSSNSALRGAHSAGR